MSTRKGRGVIRVCRVVIQNHASDIFHHLGVLPVFRWYLEGCPAACRELHTVNGKLQTGVFIRQCFLENVVVCKCRKTGLYCSDLRILSF